MQHRHSLAMPAPALGPLSGLIERLRRIQGALTPQTMPRRLLLFAAEHQPSPLEEASQDLQAILSGTAASAILATSSTTHLVLIDLGGRARPLPDSENYRCRKIQREQLSGAGNPPISIDEFRAAFVVGQQEAERASRDGIRLLAVAELEISQVDLGRLSEQIAQAVLTDSDRLAPFIEFGLGVEAAAIAGVCARAAELGLGILLDGPASVAGAIAAAHLYPNTPASLLAATQLAGAGDVLKTLGIAPLFDGWNLPPAGGIAALLAFPLLDAAAAIANTLEGEMNTGPVASSALCAAGFPRRRIAVFTGSFDPPTTYHRRVAKFVHARGFDEVIVRPTGPRIDRTDGEHAAPIHRAVMVDLAFRDLPGVSVDLGDLDEGFALDDFQFDSLYSKHGEVWHIVSADFLSGGRQGTAAIQTRWPRGPELWRSGRFVVLHPSGSPPNDEDLPPICELIAVDGHVPTADIRFRVFQGGDPNADVPEGVAEYIRRYRLFSDFPAPRETRMVLEEPRFLIIASDANPPAQAFIEKMGHLQSPDPNAILVLGGDGAMLAAIRQHWQRRLPFVGLNFGTLGFLMNERLPEPVAKMQLVLYRLPMLRVDLQCPEGRTSRSLAFADAWLERNTGQAAWLRVEVDGRVQVPRVVGDGLLVATPSGSSAYARAMGATPVPITAPVLTLAGSNVFRPRFWKPVALPENAIVRLTNIDETGKRRVRGFLDGHPLGLVSAMEVRVSSIAAVELAFTPQFDLSDRLLRSMFPPNEER